jgi:putative transposase
MIALVEERGPRVGIAPLCGALGLARATFYRRRGGPARQPRARERRPPQQALTAADRAGVLALLHEERFVDLPPAQVWAQVLDAGQVPPCSIRTMYRVLAANAEVRERRHQLRHPAYRKPELLATGPNQVWSWDITKLLGPLKWTYYYLYVLLDIFSRYVVGWLLARQEAAALAKVLIVESCARQHIGPDQLIIHADRGPSMTSQPVALLLATLGVVPSHSRPHVSNDNPFSEAQFKTLKYRPDFPDRFGAYEDAETFSQRFFPWYNREHRHGALGLMTPHFPRRFRINHLLHHHRHPHGGRLNALPRAIFHSPRGPQTRPAAFDRIEQRLLTAHIQETVVLSGEARAGQVLGSSRRTHHDG